MLENGIIILATGYPIYSEFAYNLCVSIKATDPFAQVALVHDEVALQHLLPSQLDRFDQLIPASHKGFGGKLELDLMTPFKRTIVLDADMAWMPVHPPSTLFSNLEGSEFTAITEGKINLETGEQDFNGKYFFWADLEEIKQVYKLNKGTMYQFRSEMMYFELTPRVKKMFAKARSIYKQPRLKSLKRFGTQVPDELALNIAAALTDVHPHKYKWSPSYWPKLHGEGVQDVAELYNSFYLLSAGSHTVSVGTARVYNSIVGAAAYKLGNVRTFPLQNKAKAIPDRLKF